MILNRCRTRDVLTGLSVLCVSVLCASIVCAEPRYPTRAEVTAVLARLDRQSPERRLRSLARLLDRLRFTESVANDRVMLFAFDRIVLKFREQQYIEIMRALDAKPLDGGFAAALCAAYARMSDVPAFRSWYRLC